MSHNKLRLQRRRRTSRRRAMIDGGFHDYQFIGNQQGLRFPICKVRR